MIYEIPNQANQGRQRIAEQPSNVAPADRQKVLSVVEIQAGKKLIIAGFVTAVAGIIAYCLAGFTADFGQQISAMGKTGLAMIAAGTACWFFGAVKYFHGAVQANLPEELFF